MHAEPVAWIAALPELQCAFFLLLAMLFYHRSRSIQCPCCRFSSWRSFLSRCAFQQRTRPSLSRHPPLLRTSFTPAVPLLYIPRSFASASFPYLVSLHLSLRPHFCTRIFAPRSIWTVAHLYATKLLLAIPAIFARYIGKLARPHPYELFLRLPPHYHLYALGSRRIPFGLLILAAFYFRESCPILSFALCWFVFTLAPALNLNTVALNFFTERYLYIPSVGFSILMARLASPFFLGLALGRAPRVQHCSRRPFRFLSRAD